MATAPCCVAGGALDLALNARVHALAALARGWGGPWGVPVPAYSSLLMPYDPRVWIAREALAAVRPALAEALPPPSRPGATWWRSRCATAGRPGPT